MAEPATLADIVATSRAVRETPARLEKRARLRDLFVRLASTDLRLAASYLAGETLQGGLQIGWRALVAAEQAVDRPDVLPLFAAASPASPESTVTAAPADATPPAVAEASRREEEPARDGAGAAPPRPSPALTAVNAAFAALHRTTGAGAAKKRQAILQQLFATLTADERHFLHALILGELRQGALRAVVLEAVADAYAVEVDTVRRAVMFAGSLGEVLHTMAERGPEALVHFAPRAGVPVEPMLATQAEDLEAALARLGGRAAAEWKLDGVRVQVHRRAHRVYVFSRQLRDVTALVPEVTALVQAVPVRSVVLDGELIGLDAQGRPAAFQESMARFARAKTGAKPGRLGAKRAPPVWFDSVAPHRAEAPAGTACMPPAGDEGSLRLVPLFFDVLEHDGEAVVYRPYTARRSLLESLLPQTHLVPQRVVENIDTARAMYEEALQAGHEGVVLKQIEAPYTAGRRGAAWCKVKPALTLDLVILAAEWGHGRRQGFLSNLHLGARDESNCERFFHLGKTFKGLTDAMLRDMTMDLLQLETHRDGHVVHLRPERVVEIAFDEVQRSPRYDSGFALRFARVKNFRPDKSAMEANTLDDVRAIHAAGR